MYHMVDLFLMFWGTNILFSIEAALFYIPIKICEGSFFYTFLTNSVSMKFWLFVFMYGSAAKWYDKNFKTSIFSILKDQSLHLEEKKKLCLIESFICLKDINKFIYDTSWKLF